MQRVNKHNRINLKSKIMLFVFLAAIILLPLGLTGSASAAAIVLDVNNYIYDDPMFNNGSQSFYAAALDWSNQDMVTLYNYRHSTIYQYNSDIVDVINDFNKLSESRQISLKSKLDRVYRELCDYNSTSPRDDGNGAFIKAFRQLYYDNDRNITASESRTQIENIRTCYNDFLDLREEIHNLADAISEENTEFFLSPIFNFISMIWTSFGNFIRMGTGAGGDSFIFSNAKILSFATQYKPAFLTLAYLVFIISFVSSLMNSAVRFDIADPKVLIKIFAQVIIGKVFLDAAFYVCTLILSILNNIAAGIIETGTRLIIHANFTAVQSDQPIIGPLLAFFQTFVAALPLAIFTVILAIAIVKCIIKLMVRSLELTCLITVSPVFFAFLAGENTKKYFEKFLEAFVSVTASIIFIALLYSMGSELILNIRRQVINIMDFSTLGNLIGLIAICQFINKPPKIFSRIL